MKYRSMRPRRCPEKAQPGLWWRIAMCRYRRASRMPWRAAGVCRRLPRAWRRAPAPARPRPRYPGWQAARPDRASEKVATGPARSLGEPAAAQVAAATAVTATSFGAAGAQAVVWTKRAGTTTWRRAGVRRSLPGSALATTLRRPPRRGAGRCWWWRAPRRPARSASPTVPSRSRASAPRARSAPPGWSAISAGQGEAFLDDRPMVAVGQHGTVWVAWSQGPGTRTPARMSAVATGLRSPSPTTRAGPSAPRSPCPATADTPHSACASRRCPAGR